VDGDRGSADPDQRGVHGDEIADINRLAEIHGFDRHRDGAGFRDLGGENAAADIHLAEQPAAEDIAVLVGVGGHRQRADTEIANRLRLGIQRRVIGLGIGHGFRPRRRSNEVI